MATVPFAMKLADYLNRHKLTAADFGREIGVGRSSVWRWLIGERIPDSERMTAILKATNGQVAPNDFYPAPKTKRAAS